MGYCSKICLFAQLLSPGRLGTNRMLVDWSELRQHAPQLPIHYPTLLTPGGRGGRLTLHCAEMRHYCRLAGASCGRTAIWAEETSQRTGIPFSACERFLERSLKRNLKRCSDAVAHARTGGVFPCEA